MDEGNLTSSDAFSAIERGLSTYRPPNLLDLSRR